MEMGDEFGRCDSEVAFFPEYAVRLRKIKILFDSWCKDADEMAIGIANLGGAIGPTQDRCECVFDHHLAHDQAP